MNVVAQFVRWAPVDGLPPGIRLFGENGLNLGFVAWNELRQELKDLERQLFRSKKEVQYVTMDHREKSDWLVWMLDEQGKRFCSVWFGVNPSLGWAWDGLIHFGDAGDTNPVWQSYRRYSDESYRRIPSLYSSLDDALRRRRIGF